MQVLPLPALSDNYIWLLYDEAGHAIAIDPGEAAPLERALITHGLRLHAVLLTHHHADHIGGAMALRERYAVPVYAPEDARIEAATHHVRDGEILSFDTPRVRFEVIDVPGHTCSHVAFYGEGFLFSGDTLFSLGCGRLFEGSATQMLASLDRLSSLPPTTLLCCGHEYTAANGQFAQTISTTNIDLQKRLIEVDGLRAIGQPTLPVSLASELACNPFLRVPHAQEQSLRVQQFAALRAAKDEFKP